MTGPERRPTGRHAQQARDRSTEKLGPPDEETGTELAPWRAPRWLVLAAAVLLVVALLGVRALLDSGPEEETDRGGGSDLPGPAMVAGAEGVAQEVLTTWSRPELDYATWWDDLHPLLTPRAREGYAHTDPRRVPDLEVTGQPIAEAGPTADTVTIELPTDQGTYAVALHRSGPEQTWRAVQILFPGQEGPFR